MTEDAGGVAQAATEPDAGGSASEVTTLDAEWAAPGEAPAGGKSGVAVAGADVSGGAGAWVAAPGAEGDVG